VFHPNEAWTAVTPVQEAVAASSEVAAVGGEMKEDEDFTGYMATTYTEVLDEDISLIKPLRTSWHHRETRDG
jgi:hypothetical protein